MYVFVLYNVMHVHLSDVDKDYLLTCVNLVICIFVVSGNFCSFAFALEQVSCWSKESDQGDWSSPSEFRQQTMTGGSRSKVKSRSGSHNVNRQCKLTLSYIKIVGLSLQSSRTC